MPINPQEEALLLGLGSGGSSSGSAAADPGWPTEADVLAKLALIAPDGLVTAVTEDVTPLLQAVIAEFQSPVAPDGSGGTGRQFAPSTETRYYDGNGLPELHVEDIVPGSAMTITVFGVAVPNVLLKTPRQGLGSNILVRQQASLGILGTPYAYASVWPLGKQNIAVQTTWGYAATVPVDVKEAIRCEVAFRALSQGVVDIAGAGEEVKIGSFSVNTAAGVSVWGQSSPLATLRRTYTEARNRYRDRQTWRLARMQRRMS